MVKRLGKQLVKKFIDELYQNPWAEATIKKRKYDCGIGQTAKKRGITRLFWSTLSFLNGNSQFIN